MAAAAKKAPAPRSVDARHAGRSGTIPGSRLAEARKRRSVDPLPWLAQFGAIEIERKQR